MKNVWNSSDNGGNPPEGLDEKVRKGDLVRFTHFPSFNGFVGIYLGVDVDGGRSKWKFATDREWSGWIRRGCHIIGLIWLIRNRNEIC